jgi:dTDP-4-amino-4,6-dideoxygalactose transaminase
MQNKSQINVTKTYLPELDTYKKYLSRIWENNWITNHGELCIKLENKLKRFLRVKNLTLVSNGTAALEIAIRALDITGEIITTPFSYVATTSSIVWVGCKPVFADIDPETLNINPLQIEKLITKKTRAILATHVYGNPCDVEAIERIAKKNGLKVIYDAAHCFGVKYKGRSVLKYGDISTLSFHATKLFHTAEGGAVVTDNKKLAHKSSYLRNFGHRGQEAFWGLGINGKMSELHAAMGLCILPLVNKMIGKRKRISGIYDNLLEAKPGELTKPRQKKGTTYNYSYYPIIFRSEKALLKVRNALNKSKIFPRRYFYPSLGELNYVQKYKTPVAKAVSKKILCLPLYSELGSSGAKKIAKLILENL